MTRAIDSARLMSETHTKLLDMIEHPEKYQGWKTGIPEWDKLTGGILKERFYVFGGDPKAGKSSLMISILAILNNQGVRTGNFSMEMGNQEVATRLMALIGNVDLSKFRDATLTKWDLNQLEPCIAEISKWKGYWDFGQITLEEIEKTVDELDLEVIAIDYFQLMSVPVARNSNRIEAMAELARGLKRLTTRRERPITVMIASQLNRESIRSGSYDMNAFLQTGLERDADVAALLKPKLNNDGEPVNNQRVLAIVASRVSGLDEFTVWFNGARSQIAAFLDSTPNAQNLWR